jgi:hypothetical protein
VTRFILLFGALLSSLAPLIQLSWPPDLRQAGHAARVASWVINLLSSNLTASTKWLPLNNGGILSELPQPLLIMHLQYFGRRTYAQA